MPPENNKTAKKKQPEIPVNQSQFLSNVVTFVEKSYSEMLGGVTYIVFVGGIPISLAEFTGLVSAMHGTWQSLGKAYNPDTVVRGMEITIHFVIMQEYTETFNNSLASIIEKKRKELLKQVKNNEKEDN